jgi:hypothetical protein
VGDAKFALGIWAYSAHIDDGEGFGEVLVMLALMVAVRAQVVYNRAQQLPGRVTKLATSPAVPSPSR